MAMKGFDPRWRDLPDYILGITKEIWEDRGVHTLRHYYGAEMIKRSPKGVVVGAEAVIAETVGALARHPDVILMGEDVIWSGDDEAGFLSSHRVHEVYTETHAQGHPVRISERVIADCYCVSDQITDEWLIYDSGSHARQTGRTPREMAELSIAAEGGRETAEFPFTPKVDRVGPYTGRGNDNEWGQRHVALLNAVMEANFAELPRIYDRAVNLTLPGGQIAYGVPEADRFWLGLRAAFPSATIRFEHVIGREDPLMPPRSAVRWSLSGRHEGHGMFGPPTGAEVHVSAASHAEWGPWGLRREWTLLDEVAVWKQILMQQG